MSQLYSEHVVWTSVLLPLSEFQARNDIIVELLNISHLNPMFIMGLKLTERMNFDTRRILRGSSICETACDFFMNVRTRTVNNLFQIATCTMK
jgi:hypothetical protein